MKIESLIIAIGIFSVIFYAIAIKLATAPTAGPYPMNMSITQTIALTLSSKLAEGIFYTNVTGAQSNVQYSLSTSTTANNATWNWLSGTGVTYYNISNGGNTNEDICGIANAVITCSPATPGCGSNNIQLGNATWVNGTSSNPGSSGTNIWVTAYGSANKTATSLAQAGVIHLRYWLSVPANLPAGTYNTTFTYCAVEAGQACTC